MDPYPEPHWPLRPGDAVVKLPLQEMLNIVYADGRYDVALDDRPALDEPLDVEDADWVAERLLVVGRN